MGVASTVPQSLLLQSLAWLGRQGTRALAVLVLIGIGVPPLGALLKPYVGVAVFLLLCVSFMRVDLAALRVHLQRPGLVLLATAWNAVAVPLIMGLGARLIGAPAAAPDLYLGLVLQAVASPMMAAPALAALMGLDATLVLITLVTSTALLPLSAPVFAWLLLGDALTLSPLALGWKLGAILAGAMGVAAVIRLIFGLERIRRAREPIDGANILILLVFVSAVMGSVVGSLLATPVLVLGLALLAFAVFAALLGITTWLFRRLGPEQALALGLVVSQRNMGVMLAATDGLLPGTTWLYFAMSQFPIYLSPQLLKPLAMRAIGRRNVN